MIQHSVTYTNFDGEPVTKNFWFHLDQADLIDLEMSGGRQGYSELIKIAQENEDASIVGESFRKILTRAIGRREGEYFIKDEQAMRDLVSTNAYSTLIVWMLVNPVEAWDLLQGMMPAEAQEKAGDAKAKIAADMRAKIAEMAAQDGIAGTPIPDETDEVVGQPETAYIPDDVPAPGNVFDNAVVAPEMPNFASMSEEEFMYWKNSQLG
jgi:hypothetical protein